MAVASAFGLLENLEGGQGLEIGLGGELLPPAA